MFPLKSLNSGVQLMNVFVRLSFNGKGIKRWFLWHHLELKASLTSG